MNTSRFDTFAKLREGRLSRRRALRQGGVGIAAAALAGAGLFRAAENQVARAVADPRPDLSGVAPSPLTGDLLVAFEDYIGTKLTELSVPGAAVAVVQGGQAVYLHGFGVRELGRTAPVTVDTLLRIGSVTKSFSSMLTATVVDAGRLSWDTPLVELLPTFAVADKELTPRLTVSDAFTAATGLPRRDWELILNAREFTPESIVADIAQLPLTAPYGTTYQYNNQIVAAGGYAAAVAGGGAPDKLRDAYAIALREFVLNPIAMPRTTLSLSEVLDSGDYAAPHAEDVSGSLHPMTFPDDDAWVSSVAPSGGLWSSAREMARYVQTELGRGVNPDGEWVVSAANLERTWKPGVAMPVAPGMSPELSESATNYGLGWITGAYHGLRLISHGGATLGFQSLVAFLPDADLGLVVLTNCNGSGGTFNVAVLFRMLELLFGQPATIDDELPSLAASATKERAALLTQLHEVDPAAVTPFLGRYANPALGEITLALRNGRLIFDSGAVRSELRPRADATGVAIDYRLIDPPMGGSAPDMPVTFEHDPDGQPRLVLAVTSQDLVYPYELLEGTGTAT